MKKVVGLMSNIGCGGAEVQSILLFNGLCTKGYKVKVIVLDSKRIDLADRLDKRIDVIFINRKAYLDPSAILNVKRNITETNPDFFIMVDDYPILYGLILKKIYGLNLNSVVILHSTVPPNLKFELQNKLIYGPSINILDKVVFVSKKQREYWIDKYKIDSNKAEVILNGIDLVYFEQFYLSNDKFKLRQKLRIPEKSAVIAMNASLWPAKSHEHMIEAVYRLRKSGFDLFLLIIGDGPRRNYLETLALDLGLVEHVRFTGFVKDVRPYLMCADISALTSVAVETLSIAAIESMALGKALILSNTGGAAELVDDGINGFLYAPGNIEELTNSIKKLLYFDKFLVMGEKSREKAKKLFSHNNMISHYVDLLNRSIPNINNEEIIII